jgi:thiamine monophosphate kinase
MPRLSEHEWIRRLIGRLNGRDRRVLVGPGDCAALRIGGRTLLVTTDALVTACTSGGGSRRARSASAPIG